MIDINDFNLESQKVINWIDEYYSKLKDFPVKSPVSPGDIYSRIPARPPSDCEQLDWILDDLTKVILPGITHWQHPNFHAYFPASTSIESIFAEFITAAIGAQCMIWETSPAAAELEERMMEWLLHLIGQPRGFEGVIQDSASTATLVAILSARESLTDFESNENGVPNNLRVYCSMETHSSIEKAVRICGIGRKNLVKIAVDDNLGLDSTELENQIIQDKNNGMIPCCIVATIGTTGAMGIDPLEKIAKICKKYKIWLHVDAAYAGTALILPEYRWIAQGLDKCDSFVFNPHKWLFTNFDCSAYFVKNANTLIKTLEVTPEYLKTKTRGKVNDYRDWSVPLGRRFRALKLWFVMRSFGVKGIQDRLRTHIQLNEFCASEIADLPNAELMLKPFLNFTCFRFVPKKLNSIDEINLFNEQLLEKLNLSGEIFLTHTKLKGLYGLRIVIGQTYIKKENVIETINTIKRISSDLLNKY
jgi:aromatic-L-amino-acid decarboxylase